MELPTPSQRRGGKKIKVATKVFEDGIEVCCNHPPTNRCTQQEPGGGISGAVLAYM